MLPKVLLLLVPALALLFKIAWFRRPFVEHLLFALNLQSVAMIVIPVGALMGSDAIASMLTFGVVSTHALVGARRIYGSGWLSTLARLLVVGFVYMLMFLAGVLAAGLVALALA